ncbi:putative FAD-dependent oxygenase [Venustampulla echinocandica]|uniref:Putative FAD-dependent oxygenase n=1 Tax=Venustampulla echinocandica TaxID=2656787 RepID=A0A370TJ04_9HELO|nr:putative FAD-dependent oxygenase [Venustampulla echinocandica]RDL35322.1 putative FAD-dependent oxygenase [Venustampulla echinocandica]
MYHLQLKLAALLAWAAAVACEGVVAPVPEARGPGDCPPGGVNYAQLAAKLSKAAQIYQPGSSAFNAAVARWSNLSIPVANVVVVPSTENDIVQTVKFANQNSLPFLTTNGVHGSITTLGAMTHGIEILMSQLNRIAIASDGKTATIGGGVMSKNLTDALWAAGKQTVTGTCECVSYLGPGLGGGHGWLQGRYGLISDQFVSMNVVLANGSLITIDQNSRLSWAMKGAGHNFGIVTSTTSKIYDIQHPNYAMATLIFSGDQVEAVYRVANEQWHSTGKTMPVNLINWSYWFFDPTIDPQKPVIAMYLIQEGVSAVDAAYTQPFLDLGPIINQAVSGTYRDLAAWTGISLDAPPCQKTGNANPRFPIYLKSYNTTAQRLVYNLFAQATTNASTPFSNALFMFEGYPQQGVKAISDDATAFAYRADNLLVAPLLSYKPTGPALDEVAFKLGKQMRQILYEGSGQTSLNTYVNYAYGDETPLAWYGSDAWRQTRLHALKGDFDPTGKFSFYGPIA